MSNRKLISPSIVTGIADAIRTKKGTTATIKVSELADEIASIPTGGMADSTKELVNVVSGVTPTDEISLNNGIASGVVDAPSVHSWADTRTTADGGTIKDGVAYVKALRGKSVKVAQLRSDTITSRQGDTEHISTTIEKDIVTITANGATGYSQIVLGSVTLVSGHKYLLMLENAPAQVQLYTSGNAITTTGESKIMTPSANVGNRYLYMFIGQTIADGTYKVKTALFDLTEMGIDSLTTTAAVANYFGCATLADLPFFTKGNYVLNCKQKSVKSVSRNLWDETWETGNINYLTGANLSNSAMVRSKGYIPCEAGTIYRVSNNVDPRIIFYDSNKAYIGYNLEGLVYFTVPDGAAYMRFKSIGNYGATYQNDIIVHRGRYAIDYVPYFTDTLTFPTLTAFPNGLCGVGTAYDEVRLAEGKATKRINRSTFNGTEDWKELAQSDGVTKYFQLTMGKLGMNPYSSATFSKDQICNKYKINNPYSTKNCAWLYCDPNGNCFMRVHDENYSSAADWKTHLATLNTNGDPLFILYEVSEPTESTFTPCRAYYKASNNGQEVATADTATAPFTAEIGYKEPTATELANALNA